MSYLNSDQIKNAILKRNINIDPYFDEFQGPNLYYCHLGGNFLIPKKSKDVVDPFKNSEKFFHKIVNCKKKIIFKPGEFILAETFELFSTGDNFVIRLFNSSSLARLGISHCATGMINPGCGKEQSVRLTLELVNNSPFSIILQPTIVTNNKIKVLGTEILKIAVIKMNKKVSKSYSNWHGSLYGKDMEVNSSKMNKRYEDIKDLIIPNNSMIFK